VYLLVTPLGLFLWVPRSEMKRFLLHKIGSAIFAVGITSIGREAQTVLTQQFQSWLDAERYFLKQGATQQILDRTQQDLNRAGTARLTF